MADSNAASQIANLSVTLAPLVSDATGDAIKAALDRVADVGIRFIQLSATMPGLRPRDLDRAARRDLLASLRRRELTLSGLDAWIPVGHFSDPANSDRAMQAVMEAVELAGDLDRVPVSLILPGDAVMAHELANHAHRIGVSLADHAIPLSVHEGVGAGIDPAAWLSQSLDVVAAVHTAGSRLVSARLADLTATGMRGPIGTRGDQRLDVADYKIALSVNGYRRPIIIDARQWNEPWRGIEQSMRVWNAM